MKQFELYLAIAGNVGQIAASLLALYGLAKIIIWLLEDKDHDN